MQLPLPGCVQVPVLQTSSVQLLASTAKPPEWSAKAQKADGHVSSVKT
jgi:hypothetical protein